MSEMPERIWINHIKRVESKNLTYVGGHSMAWAVKDEVEYIRADIAESLYDALNMACMKDCGRVMHAQAAIEAYRKAKGE